MASLLDKVIQAQRYIDLKARVKAECLRRNKVGPVSSYGGSEYDYTNNPTTNNKIMTEHYSKNIVPLRAINSSGLPTEDSNRAITDNDLLVMETKLAAFESRSIYDRSATDCSASCTGTCTTSCSGSCSNGCTGDCDGSCQGSCYTGCTGCGGICSTNCTNGCGVGCTGQCYRSCYGDCGGGCGEGGCSTGCVSGCANTCGESCSFCGTNCSGACGTRCSGIGTN